MVVELILYACPTGALAEQVEAFFAESKRRIGPNSAHAYMPHCTLTGFFHADAAAISRCVDCAEGALRRSLPTRPVPPIKVDRLCFEAHWHYLALRSQWACYLAADFAREAAIARPIDAIGVKDDLHLSLAHRFPPEQSAPLAGLAREMVNPRAPVAWELRLYQRHPDGAWTCHWTAPLDDADVR
jgi:ubiquitin-associated SH3 domain-containing protein